VYDATNSRLFVGEGALRVKIFDVAVADITAPVISEITPIPTGTDTTPDYTFTTNEAGTITYGGSCAATTTAATSGSNTITFNTLTAGTYINCTITVTDSSSNVSNILEVTPFIISAPEVIVPPTVTPTGGWSLPTGGSSGGQGGIPYSLQQQAIQNPNQSTNPTSSNIYQFNNSLRFGMVSPDVKKLQQFLNTHGFLIALTGPGSVGKETTRFGPATKAALIRFQLVNKITPASGFFGPLTREVVNAMK
jgi:hypothetical protein